MCSRHSFGTAWTLKSGRIACPETSVTTIPLRVIAHMSEDLLYTAAVAWSHAWNSLAAPRRRECFQRKCALKCNSSYEGGVLVWIILYYWREFSLTNAHYDLTINHVRSSLLLTLLCRPLRVILLQHTYVEESAVPQAESGRSLRQIFALLLPCLGKSE
jgi:hypothetical protein